jgi:hypothetical protein
MKPQKYFMKKTSSGWKRIQLQTIPENSLLEPVYERITPGTVIEEPKIVLSISNINLEK